MTAVTFDTHFYIKRLRERGVPEDQAEAFVQVVTDARETDINSAATKADLNQLAISTKADLRELELKLDNQLKDMQIKLGGMIVALGGVLIAIKYFG